MANIVVNIFEADKIRKEVQAETGAVLEIHDPCGGNLYFTMKEPNAKAAELLGQKMSVYGLTAEVSEDGLLISFK